MQIETETDIGLVELDGEAIGRVELVQFEQPIAGKSSGWIAFVYIKHFGGSQIEMPVKPSPWLNNRPAELKAYFAKAESAANAVLRARGRR